MVCGPESHSGGRHGGHHHGGFCDCGCNWPMRFGPHFWTKDEKIAWLGERLKGLQEEAKTVEERIAAVKGEK